MPYERVLELICQIVLKVLETQPPEVAAELWREHLAIIKAMKLDAAKVQELFQKLIALVPPLPEHK